MIRISIPYLITIIVSILLLFAGHNIAVDKTNSFQTLQHEMVRANVQTIVERTERVSVDFDYLNEFNDDDLTGLFEMKPGYKIIFEAKITRGTLKGKVVTAEQTFSPLLIDRTKEINKGDKVLLINNDYGWFFGGYIRSNKLFGLGFLFAFLLLLFGEKKGFNTILSLGFTCAAIFAVFIPSILSGKNIYLMSILVCIYTITMTLLIVIGYNKKSLAAIAGCTGGLMIAGIITIIMDRALYFTGIVDEHSRFLVHLPGNIELNLNAIIFAGIIIGAMGAIMDVAISISSSLWEVKEKATIINFKDLFRCGINIGRDIMGSMANTLILAYIGGSLTIVLLLSVYSGSLLNLFNSEMIAVEILQALAGSLGILFAMPLTAIFCSIVYLKE